MRKKTVALFMAVSLLLSGCGLGRLPFFDRSDSAYTANDHMSSEETLAEALAAAPEGKPGGQDTMALSAEAVSAETQDTADKAFGTSGDSVSASEAVSEEEAVSTPTPTPELSEEEKTYRKHEGLVIAIDPGHQGPGVNMSAQEPDGPGSSTTKKKASSGTAGRFSGVGEYQLNLDIALAVRDILEEEGYTVVMTREDNETAISNSERAILANESGALFSLRIHANGSENSSVEGALMLVPGENNKYIPELHDESVRIADYILTAYCESTGLKNAGIKDRNDMTGFNWSTIPCVLIEMGYMTNKHDDLLMTDPAFQPKMVEGIVHGVDNYVDAWLADHGAETYAEAVAMMAAGTDAEETAAEETGGAETASADSIAG